MNRRVMSLLCLWAVSVIAVAPGALGQDRQSAPEPGKIRIRYFVPPNRLSAKTMAKIRQQAGAGTTIPMWDYSIVAYDGRTYQGTMVGRSPFFHGHRITVVPTYLIPLKLTFLDTGAVFDASAPDPCAPGGASVSSIVVDSPIFQNSDFIMNGVDVGSAQYLDAFQRASFWTDVGGTPYHTVFSTTPTVLPVVSVSVPVADGVTVDFGGCGLIGEMDIGWWDNYLQNTLIPSLAAQGVGPANFPQFVSDSVFESEGGGCCALGYHNAFLNNGIFQSYSMNAYDTSGVVGGDISVMSHEVAEWMDDPGTNNPTPAWGQEGQVFNPPPNPPACQPNLETGDPLSPNPNTPTNPFSVMLNGNTFTLQELAFYSWYFGQNPSLGAGGGYSDNGTFTGFAKPCPPGGTN
jgi:hypothetical protein